MELPSGRIGVDSAIFIYFIQQHQKYAARVRRVFQSAAAGRRELVTSAVTLLEVLIIPYRQGNVALAERYEALLSRSRGLRMVEIDRRVLKAAAQLRAVHGTRTPDAIQLATAALYGCVAFLTNDRRLPEPGLRVIQLEEIDGSS
jgi:predicted nucleic acid-binding protein